MVLPSEASPAQRSRAGSSCDFGRPSGAERARAPQRSRAGSTSETSAGAVFSSSQAEQFLLGFRKHPQPLPVCNHLLLTSVVGYAKLQALYTVRECLGTLWSGLTPEQRTELQLIVSVTQERQDNGKSAARLECKPHSKLPQ